MLREPLVAEEAIARIYGRHAFVYERLLELIVRENDETSEWATFNKSDMAKFLRCSLGSVDSAVKRLHAGGLIERKATFNSAGAQVGNRYRATPAGEAIVRSWVGPDEG